MVAERLRIAGIPASFVAAFMLALTLVWVAEANSKPRPEPPDRIAEVQILGLNETHGQLVPLSQRNLVDTVVRYLELHSPVDPQVEGRLTVE